MFKVNNKETSVFFVNFEYVSHLFLMFLLLFSGMYMFVGDYLKIRLKICCPVVTYGGMKVY